MKPKYIIPLSILAICFFMPFEARADGISIPILLGGGFIVFAPIILFISLLEATIIFKPLKLSFGYSFTIMLIANILSMLSGIPVKIVNMIFYYHTMPKDLYEYFNVYPYLVTVGTLFYFIVSILVEYLYLRHVYIRTDHDLNFFQKFKMVFRVNVTSFFTPLRTPRHSQNWKKLAKWLLIANIASYAIMAPLNYYVTKPRHDIQEFTPDSSWAQQPASPIYYIDHKNRLAMIMSDSTNRKIIEDKPVSTSSFHIAHDGKRYYSQKSLGHDENGSTKVLVYWGLGSCIQADYKGKRFWLAVNPGLLHIAEKAWRAVALLPNGKEAVFCDKDNIYLMDLEKRRVGKITSGSNFVLTTQLFQKKTNGGK